MQDDDQRSAQIKWCDFHVMSFFLNSGFITENLFGM